MSRRLLAAALLLIGDLSLGEAQTSTGPPQDPTDYATARLERVARPVRVTAPITLDGRLDEEAWGTAQPATDFIQWEPSPGMPASDRTEVRFLYDARNLYVGARCFDTDPAHLTVTQLLEDFTMGESDGIIIMLDSLHDRQSGFLFSTNPVGARRDTQLSQDGDQLNPDWDSVWDVKVAIDETGWTAEFVIPFKTLRFSSSPTQEWGLNILRRVRRRNEDSIWAPLPRRYRIQRASLAGTLTGLEGIRQGRNLKIKPYAMSSVTELSTAPRAIDGNGGLDVKYGLTPSMTLDLTYRTDFSQVEADQQQVNLTRFSLLFPEKREFFLENAGVFALAGGGLPTGATGGVNLIPFFSRRIGLSGDGTPIPMVGGARLSGKAGSYDVGLLAMKTERRGELPPNTFLVGRLRKNFATASSIGAIVTSRDSTAAGDSNRLYGVDTLLRFRERLEVTSYLLRTGTPGLSGRDQARLVGAAWRDNDLTLGAQFEDVQPNFRADLGFARRTHMAHYSGEASWRPRPRNNTRIRNFNLDFNSDYYEDGQGRLETREHRVGAGATLQGSAAMRIGATNIFERLTESFAIRPGIVIPSGDYEYQRYSASFNTDRGKRVSADFNVGAGEFWNGHSRSAGGTLDLRPSHHFNLELTLSRNSVDLPAGTFTTTLVGTRILWAFTSKAFLHSFLQYNATTHQFSANTRFNIIHRPLSDLYVVYNDRRDTQSGALLERGLIVKFTNLFDF